jgi:putative transposase
LTQRRRNSVEHGFNRLKHWRGVATRYDIYALTHLGGVTVAAAITANRLQLADTP